MEWNSFSIRDVGFEGYCRAMNYPLLLSFKIVAFAPQLKVTDVNGALVCFVRQKMFKLKEAVDICTRKPQH